MKVLWLAAGAAVGYLFGTRAGRERYEQIKSTAQEWADKPAVTEVVDRVGQLAERGKDAVTAKLSGGSDDATVRVTPERTIPAPTTS